MLWAAHLIAAMPRRGIRGQEGPSQDAPQPVPHFLFVLTRAGRNDTDEPIEQAAQRLFIGTLRQAVGSPMGFPVYETRKSRSARPVHRTVTDGGFLKEWRRDNEFS
jgi:hypothetical protein